MRSASPLPPCRHQRFQALGEEVVLQNDVDRSLTTARVGRFQSPDPAGDGPGGEVRHPGRVQETRLRQSPHPGSQHVAQRPENTPLVFLEVRPQLALGPAMVGGRFQGDDESAVDEVGPANKTADAFQHDRARPDEGRFSAVLNSARVRIPPPVESRHKLSLIASLSLETFSKA